MGGFYACTVCTGHFIKQPLLDLLKSVLNAQMDSGLQRRCLNSTLAFRHVWLYVLQDALVPALSFCPVKLLSRNGCPGILYASFPYRKVLCIQPKRREVYVHFKETKRVKMWVLHSGTDRVLHSGGKCRNICLHDSKGRSRTKAHTHTYKALT